MQEEGSERYPVWTGEELPALRKARRERVRELAEHLNLNRSDRAISEWAAAAPRTNRRRVLDQDLVNHLLRVVPPDMLPWLKGWLLERAPALGERRRRARRVHRACAGAHGEALPKGARRVGTA
jgi:hypothetical protein